MSEQAVVMVKCLGHEYPSGIRVDVSGLEFKVMQGQRVAILGANGSGKSTLLKHILGLLKPSEGEVRVFGIDPSSRYDEIRPKIGAMMQNVEEQLIGPTVFDDVAFMPLNLGLPKKEVHSRVEEILRSLGIYELRNRLPHYLSGGERKKVALAGALVIRPELLILDEPLAEIDYASRIEIASFLRGIHHATGMTMITTIHDMELVREVADFGYLMGMGGGLKSFGSIKDLFFQHDLSAYNLAPPVIVQLINELQRVGLELNPTLSIQDLRDQIMGMLGNRCR